MRVSDAWLSVGALCALAALVVSGCSLSGLDRFEWPSCAECDALNASHGLDPATACALFRCVPERDECVFLPRDLDGDGHLGAGCGDDCDDARASASPDAPEVCNGEDDDCDGVVDDAPLAGAPVAATLVTATAETPAWGTNVGAEIGALAAFGEGAAARLVRVGSIDASDDLGARALETVALGATSSGAMSRAGCAVGALEPFEGLPSSCSIDTDCGPGETCVDTVAPGTPRRRCGVPLAASADPSADECLSDAACDDENPCDGIEECAPPNATTTHRFCREGTRMACASAGAVCDVTAGGCRVVDPVVACGLEGLALAPLGGDDWLASGITRAGCAEGTLRIAHTSAGGAGAIASLRAPEGSLSQVGDAFGWRSRSWLGIDAGRDGCATQRAGRGASAPVGVSGVRAAGLARDVAAGRRRPQALVAWLAAPSCRGAGACPSPAPVGATGPVGVEVVGVWLEERGAASSRVAWLNATDDGEPTRLATRAIDGATAPALAAWSGDSVAGYVLAVPAEGGGLAVHVVAALADPAPSCASASDTPPCLAADADASTDLGSAPFTRATPSLDVPAAAALFADATPRGDVAIAVGRTEPDGAIALRFAWAEADAVVVAAARLAPSTREVTEGERLRVSATDASDVVLAHLAAGLLRVGARRGTAVATGDGDLGGFVVLFRDGAGALSSVRIADLDGQPLDDAPVTWLADAAPALARPPWPFVGDDGRAGVLVHLERGERGAESTGLYAIAGLCGDAAP